MKRHLFLILLAIAVNGLPGCSRKHHSSQRLQESAVDRAYKVDSPRKSESGSLTHSGTASRKGSTAESETGSPEGTEVAIEAGPETSMNIEPGVPRIWQNGPSAKEKARRNTVHHRRPVVTDQLGTEGVDRLGAPLLDTTGLKRID